MINELTVLSKCESQLIENLIMNELKEDKSQCKHNRESVSQISYCSDVLKQCDSKKNVQIIEVMFSVQWTVQKYLKFTLFIETQLTEVSSADWQFFSHSSVDVEV